MERGANGVGGLVQRLIDVATGQGRCDCFKDARDRGLCDVLGCKRPGLDIHLPVVQGDEKEDGGTAIRRQVPLFEDGVGVRFCRRRGGATHGGHTTDEQKCDAKAGGAGMCTALDERVRVLTEIDLGKF